MLPLEDVIMTKEVNPRLAKRPLIFNGRLANRGLTSLAKKGHRGLTAGLQAYPLKLIYRFASSKKSIYDGILK